MNTIIIPLTRGEWEAVEWALVKRIEALENWPAEHGYDKPSESDQAVIDGTRALLQKIAKGKNA